MFGNLLPKDDAKQRIRAQRTLQAIGGGVSQTLVSIILFMVGGFRLELQGFLLLMLILWIGHLSFFFIIRLGINLRFYDPSMTREMVVWSTFTLLITVFCMDRFRPLMMMFFPIILTYGAFSMTAGQYRKTAAIMILGYVCVIFILFTCYPRTMHIKDELVVALVFALVVVAFSFVTNQISSLRNKLRKRNEDLAKAMQKIEQMAITDELTGIINRRHMIHLLENQKRLADRGSIIFSICFFDIDHFKKINDTLGHHIGDVVLKRLACTVQSQLRGSDLWARFGGEEFVFAVIGVDRNEALFAANRIRKTIEALSFDDVATDLKVTVSGGVAQYRCDEKIQTVLSRADQALYLAKDSGRNCIKMETDL